MNDLELRSWKSFVDVAKNFWGNCRIEEYKELVERLLKSLQDIGANMSIKVHFLHSHLDNDKWWARWTIPSGYENNERALSGTVEPTNNGWLPLEYQKGLK